MADLAVVALGLDTSGMKRGEQQAVASLRHVETEMQKAEKQADHLSRGLTTSLDKSGSAFSGFGNAARGAGTALQGLGGPIGQVTNSISGLVGQMGALGGALGVVVGGLAAVAVGFVAAAAAVTRFALDGVKLSSNIDDVGQALGFTHEQIERFNAAARISGEDIGFLESAFARFESAIQEGIADPASKSGKALQALGVDARKAATAPQAEFAKFFGTLDQVTGSIVKQTAAHDLLGRATFKAIRISEELRTQSHSTFAELEAGGLVVSEAASLMSRATNKAFNEMLLQFETLERKLIVDLGPAFIEMAKAGSDALRSMLPVLKAVATATAAVLGPLAKALSVDDFQPRTTRGALLPGQQEPKFDLSGTGDPNLRTGKLTLELSPEEKRRLPGAVGGRAGRTEPLLPDATAQQLDAQRVLNAAYEAASVRTEDLGAATKQAQLDVSRLTKEMQIMAGTRGFDAIVDQFLRANAKLQALQGQVRLPVLSTKDVQLVLGQSGVPGGGGVGPIPGNTIEDALPPDRIKSARSDRKRIIDQEAAFLFDDFIISMQTGRRTTKEALGDFGLGIVQIFAAEFSAALRKAFIDPVIEQFTDLLTGALDKMFNALKPALSGLAEGIGEFFGGLFKGGGFSKILGIASKVFGAIFGLGGGFAGGFRDGGTIPANSWGLVGERGKEFAFSGSRPLHIVPQGAMGGGGGVTINFAINAPSGSISRRTQSQLAESVYQAVQSASRQKGA